MTRTARILITIIVIALTDSGTGASANAEAAGAQQQLGAAAPLTTTEAELMAWGAELFSDHGMDLPNGVIASFHDDRAPCEGNLGLFTFEDESPRVRVCWVHANPGVQRRLQEQALVHELAHAWVHNNVSDGTRGEFIDLVGAESWNDRSSEWHERGTERAADLITWALLDPAVLFVDFENIPCANLPAAFELLTASPAPHSITVDC